MSDARVRELARLAAEGDLGAHVRLRQEELRAGIVTPKQLEAAANLGDAGARALLAVEVPDDPARAIESLTRPSRLRAAVLLVARFALEVLEGAKPENANTREAARAVVAVEQGKPLTSIVRALVKSTRERERDLRFARALRAVAWVAASAASPDHPSSARMHAACAVKEALAALSPDRARELRSKLIELVLTP
jgi:hypothetical protein